MADLAQSSFGEQPGVSNFVVWESVEHMIADHRQHGPLTVDFLFGDDQRLCGACGTDLKVSKAAVPPSTTGPSFRDHPSPTMRETLAFEYFEVRPCIEVDRQVRSYRDEDEFIDDLAAAQKSGREFRAFWSLYGVDRGATMAIGDFVSKDAAHEVMNAILAIPAAVCNAIKTKNLTQAQNNTDVDMTARSVADWLDDMINQSSNNQRI
ncbi:hypothetical protein QBK99_22555 [Corticibacterium sp. UT-5YL-CI-8]|nr:hypothetical protein [Tianweitania sp. UT-5YL-CI-8]